MVQAALKAVPLGQAPAQRILAALAAAIPGAVDARAALPAAEMQAFAPMLAILSAQHEDAVLAPVPLLIARHDRFTPPPT